MARPCIDCGTVTTATRCRGCAYLHEKHRRPSFRQRGYDAEYRRNRATILANHPTCELCHRAPATTADHITPISRGGTSALTNLRPACATCNSRRGAANH